MSLTSDKTPLPSAPPSPSHALILEGGDAGLRGREVLLYAAAWLCPVNHPPSAAANGQACGVCPVCRRVLSGAHPDLHRTDSEAGSSIKVETIRALRRALALRPVEDGYSCAVIERAEALTPSAQNALLTLLEDPPSAVRLILCTPSADSLLSTIRSRCVILTLRGADTNGLPSAEREQGAGWLWAKDDWERATLALSWEKLGREALCVRLEAITDCVREALETGQGEPQKLWKAAALCREATEALERNASVGIVCGLLMISPF